MEVVSKDWPSSKEQYQNASSSEQLFNTFTFSTFLNFARSESFHQRLIAARRCVIALQILTYNSANQSEFFEFLSVFEEFLLSEPEIKIIALEHTKNVFNELKKVPFFFNFANERISHQIVKLLSSSIMVQTSVVDAITILYEENCFTEDTIMQTIVPSLFHYVLDLKVWKNESENAIEKWFLCRINVVTILNKIASSVFQYPKTWVYNNFLPRFSAFFIDSNAVVRKLSIEVIGVFAHFFGEFVTENGLIPHLKRAVHDENYHVRKLCCDVFVEVALNCSIQTRTDILTPLFLHLLGDLNKNVRESAVCQIGHFIATFADPNKTGIEIRNGQLTKIKSISKKSEKNEHIDEKKSKDLTKFSSIDDLTKLKSLNLKKKNNFNKTSNYNFTNNIEKLSENINENKLKDDKYLLLPEGFCMPDQFENNLTLFKKFQNLIVEKIKNENSTPKNIDKLDNNFSFFSFENDQNNQKLNQLKKNSMCTIDNLKNNLNSNIFYWSFDNINLEEEIKAYCLRMNKIKKISTNTGLSKDINKSMLVNQNLLNNFSTVESKNKSSNNYLSFTKSDDNENNNLNSLITINHQNNNELNDEKNKALKQKKNFNVEEKSLIINENCSSSYWQKRMDILHRSMQSIVNNGSNALAVTASIIPSLKRLSFDTTNSSNSLLSQDLTTKCSKSLIDKNILKGRVNTKQTSIFRSLSTVVEDENYDLKSKDSFGKSTPSRFTVSNLDLNLYNSNHKNNNITYLNLKSNLHDDNKNLSTINKNDEKKTAFINEDLYESFNGVKIPKIVPNLYNILKETIINEKNKMAQKDFFSYSCEKNLHNFLTKEDEELLKNLKQDVIPQELLDRLKFEIEMTAFNDLNIIRNIAQTIPAIVYTFGSSKWIFIKGLYLFLTDHYKVEVRECMAHSLHEIAAIIGTKNADCDLLPVFFKFLSDTPEVQYGLLKHLFDFCKILSLPFREKLAQSLNLFVTVDNTRSYRLRANFAEQLVLLVPLFTPVQVNCYLSAFGLTFSTDQIAEVRNNGVKILAEILALFICEEWKKVLNNTLKTENEYENYLFHIDNSIQSIPLPLTDSLLNEIRAGFWRTRNWRRRQSFGRILYFILQKNLISEEQFFYIFYNDFMHLSEDEVSNVRQYFCTICQLTKSSDFFKMDRSVSLSVKSKLREIIEEDCDLEIRHQAQIALGELDPDTAILDLSCREALLYKASESIYQYIRENQKMNLKQLSLATTENNTSVSSQVTNFLSLRNIINKPSFENKLSENINTTLNSSFHYYEYYNNNFNKPTLANPEDESDNIKYDLQIQSFSDESIKKNILKIKDNVSEEIYIVLNELLSIIESNVYIKN